MQHLRTLALSLAFAVGTAELGLAQLVPDQAVSPRAAPGAAAGPAQTVPDPSRNSRATDPLDWGLTPDEHGFSPGETTGMGVRERNQIGRSRGVPPE